jgi:hypothetical protein
MENGLSASDVALMNRDTGFGGEAFMWIFALLILAGGGFGGLGYGGNAVTQDAMQNGFNFNDLQDQNRDIMGAITNGTAQSVATTNQTFHDSLFALNDKYSELARDISGVNLQLQQVLSNQNECCCSTKMEIAQNRYESALNTAKINETTVAQSQKILDALAQNKIEALQAQVNALELQNAVAGVVRYPNSWVYDAGKAPFCTCTTTTPTTGA